MDKRASFARFGSFLRLGWALGFVGFLAACAAAPENGDVRDPNEKFNRKVHSFNIALDKHLLRPTSSVYGSLIPDPVKTSFSNFAANLDGPGDVANDLLQAKVGSATKNSLRFLVNSTVGLAGLFDPARLLAFLQSQMILVQHWRHGACVTGTLSCCRALAPQLIGRRLVWWLI